MTVCKTKIEIKSFKNVSEFEILLVCLFMLKNDKFLNVFLFSFHKAFLSQNIKMAILFKTYHNLLVILLYICLILFFKILSFMNTFSLVSNYIRSMSFNNIKFLILKIMIFVYYLVKVNSS